MDRALICRWSLLTLVFALAPSMTLAKPKPAKQDPPGDPTEFPLNGAMVSLEGQAGLPVYLKCNQHMLGGLSGLRGGEARTTDTDFINKDFVFDLVFEFKPGDDRHMAHIGIGENGRDGGWIVNSVLSELSPPKRGGSANIAYPHESKKGHIGGYKTAGPHLFRMAKKGDALTFSITRDFKGKYRADFVSTIPDFKQTASYLNRLNSCLFFGGEADFKAVRLEVDGKVIDPGPPVRIFPEYTGADGWMKFEPGNSLPPYFAGHAGVGIGKGGLEFDGHVLLTKAADYINKDFTLDVVYNMSGEQKKGMLIGLGENGRNDGNWILNSVCSRVSGPHGNGVATVTFHDFFHEPEFAKLGKDHPGPNLFRLEKRGNTLLMAITADYKGKYEPDFVAVVPSLKWQTPYLNDKNSYLFIGEGGFVEQMRLIVDGKPVTGGEIPVVASRNPVVPAPIPAPPNPVKPAIPAPPVVASKLPVPVIPAPIPPAGVPPVNIASMFHPGGSAGLPAYLRASSNAVADAQGLRGEVRTLSSDLINHDFIFDLLYAQAGEDHDFFAGIGEGIHDGHAANAIAFKAIGPNSGGRAVIDIAKAGEISIGKLGDNATPNLLRVQKRGNSLSFSVWVNYSDRVDPDFVQSIPDLKTAAPYLTRLNSVLFFEGGGTVLGLNLSIDGKPAGASGTPVAATIPPPAAPAPTGAENLIKLTGPRLPAFFETQFDLNYTNEGLLLKDKTIRTRQADFINKDFTFDIAFHISNDHERLIAGIGENAREGNWIRKSVVADVDSPGGGNARIKIDGAPDIKLGPCKDPGTHMLRIQKRGNTLTFAMCLNYQSVFTADLVKTLPDLKAVAPYLDAQNSRLFISDGSVIEQVRLIVEGQSTESTDLAFDLPQRVVEGVPLRAQIVKNPGAKQFSLGESAPKGMALSPIGGLTWTPAHDQVGLHEFQVKITERGQTTLQTAGIEVIGAEDAKAVAGDLAKVDALYRLPLETNNARLIPGLGGNSLLLLEDAVVRKLDADGFTVRQTWTLPQAYKWIGERQDYFVAMSDQSKSLDIIDKKTMKITRSLQMDYFRRFDLALHPTRPISYVSVEKPSGRGGSVKSILVVDELTGDVREPEHFVGTFIKVSEDGSRLFAGYKDIYKKGDELLLNPDRIDIIPVYGDIDILIVYDIARPHDPIEIAAKNDAGANGFGIAASRDGRRVSYLSFVGYPLYSKNIAAWDPEDLTKRPVSYPTKANSADCKKVAFHPVLPIVVAPTKTGAVCFERETGSVEPERLDLRTPIGEVKVNDLIFSPDGRNLILECESQGDHFLRRVKLNLSPAELAKLKEGLTPKPAEPQKIHNSGAKA